MTYKGIACDIKLSLTSSTPRAFVNPPNYWNNNRYPSNGAKKRPNYDNNSPAPQSCDKKRPKFDGTKKGGWYLQSVATLDFPGSPMVKSRVRILP